MAATVLPVEICDRIPDFFQFSRSPYRPPHQSYKVLCTKRELSSQALVCHTWAKKCQPMIFDDITLRSADDLAKLLSFAAHRGCHIAHHLRTLKIVQNEPSPPWLHQLFFKLRRACHDRDGSPFFHLGHFTLELEGPLSFVQMQGDIHGALPRKLPAFSRGIALLSLANVRFKSLGNLVDLTRQLPSLRSVSCCALTWEVPPSEDSSRLISFTSRRVAFIHPFSVNCCMSGCEDSWAAVVLACAMPGTRQIRWSSEGLSAMARLARAVAYDVPRVATCAVKAGILCTRSCYLEVAIDLESLVIMPFVHFDFSNTESLTYDHIQTVSLLFSAGCMLPLSEMVGYNWERFDEVVATLPYLRTVAVGFSTPEDMRLFDSFIGGRMTHLHEGSLLRYAIWVKEESTRSGGWVPCSRDASADDLKFEDCVTARELHHVHFV